jgi:hypothetical protein
MHFGRIWTWKIWYSLHDSRIYFTCRLPGSCKLHLSFYVTPRSMHNTGFGIGSTCSRARGNLETQLFSNGFPRLQLPHRLPHLHTLFFELKVPKRALVFMAEHANEYMATSSRTPIFGLLMSCLLYNSAIESPWLLIRLLSPILRSAAASSAKTVERRFNIAV